MTLMQKQEWRQESEFWLPFALKNFMFYVSDKKALPGGEQLTVAEEEDTH